MNQAIMIVEIVAFIAFIIAAMYAFSRYIKTKRISNAWLSITTALLLFALVALINSIQLIPGLDVFKGIEVLILLIGATILGSTFSHYKKERELAKDGKDGNLKKKDGKRYEEIERWLGGV